jgi:hypothetical protein
MDETRLETLFEICKRFNDANVKYVICGAFASKLHGVEKISKQLRPTKDYDFIIESSTENVKRIKKALKGLFSKIGELRNNEFEKYATIQIVEEKHNLVIDLIAKMWGVDYKKAIKDAVIMEFEEIKVPVTSIDKLLKMKEKSYRPQDRFDTYWLKKIKESIT